ncbi:DNA/RNA helicase domain-containing protein [Enterococcus casseliflavus]|uniref:DNA/RNA helicase domain-containing protein n=1 Tax=Enterococcus casseliflavus TaxID=37734 RepID=UPI001892CA4B|nr:DNA/RNA helicase domain-containing protein [Enterococcus casseliflavus]
MLDKFQSFDEDSEIEFNDNEVLSWKNSLPILIKLINQAGLTDLDLIMEYETPLNSRIDALLVGYNKVTARATAMIIELKQWQSINTEFTESNTFVKLGNVEEESSIRSHPIAQTHTYRSHLKCNHSNLGDNQADILEIQYLHNYKNKEELFSNQYDIYNSKQENCFVLGEEHRLIELLRSTFDNSESREITNLIVTGQYSMEKQGYENLAKALNSQKISPLLDEQRDVSVRISKLFRESKEKQLIIISGDCGTGKTYLGLYLLKLYIDLMKSKKVAFTVTSKILNAIINGHTGTYTPYVNYLSGEFDLVIIDEAHRLQDLNAVLDKLYIKNKAKFVIVLQDDRQRVRIKEEGLRQNFYDYVGNSPLNIELHQEYLSIQKRSMYESSYVDRINDLFSLNPVANEYTKIDGYYIQVMERLNDIDLLLDNHIDSQEKAQWFAPFCWEWTRNIRNNDVQILEENFTKPWNPKDEQFEWYSETRKHHKDRIGCIYTAQGLDFDYVGYIFWEDLSWSLEKNEWIVNLNKSQDIIFIREIVQKYGGQLKYFDKNNKHWVVNRNGREYKLNTFIAKFGDPEEVKELILNTYRVLMTRARKGIYIWFKDNKTKEKVMEFLN